MALVRYAPAAEFGSLQQEMNRLFSTFFDTPTNGGATSRRWVPAIDLVEGDDHYVLRADLPGLGEDDVTIEVQDRVLTISGEREDRKETRDRAFYLVERSTGRFSRALTLPEGVDPEAIAASFDKGVLEVRIPKPAERKPHKIAISVGNGQPAIEGTTAE